MAERLQLVVESSYDPDGITSAIDEQSRLSKSVSGTEAALKQYATSVDQSRLRTELLSQKTGELAGQVLRGERSIEDATEELGRYRHALGDVAEESAKVPRANERSSLSFTELKSKIDIAKEAYQAVSAVTVAFYGVLKEGADLEAAREKYDALAESIGTVGDALLIDLRAATKGLVSDADLITGSTELMNLGLSKTHEETVRWSRAVATLGLDLQVLGLTLANDSTARLDSLGLSMEVVAEKTERFKEAGEEATIAFDLAVLEALEEKMELFGEAADTTAGKLQRLEANWDNLTNRAKGWVATRWEPMITGLVNTIDAVGAAQTDLDKAVEMGMITQGRANAILQDATLGFDYAQRELRDMRARVAEVEKEEAQLASTTEQLNEQIERHNRLQNTAGDEMDDSAKSAEDLAAELIAVAEAKQLALQETRDFKEGLDETDAALRGIDRTTAYELEAGMKSAALAAEEMAQKAEAAQGTFGTLTEFADGLKGSLDMAAESYRMFAAEAAKQEIMERLQEQPLEAALAYISLQEAMGLITADEAAGLEEWTIKTSRLNDVTGELFERYMEDGRITKEELADFAEEVENIESRTYDAKGAIEDYGASGYEALDGVGRAAVEVDGKLGMLTDEAYPITVDATSIDEAIAKTYELELAMEQAARDYAASFSITVQSAVQKGLVGPEELGVPGFATGGSFVVPPGYPDDSYLMRVSSGERVDVTPPGQSAASSIVINVDARGASDPSGVMNGARSGVEAALLAEGRQADIMMRMR